MTSTASPTTLTPQLTPPPANLPGTADAFQMSPKQILIVVALAITAIVVCVAIIATQYPKASDAASVLGVVIPALSGALGLILGGGAGQAAGAAGKQAAQQKVQTASQQAGDLADQVQSLLALLKETTSSQAGSDRMTFTAAATRGAGIPHAQLDDITAALGRLQGTLSSS